MLKPFAAAVAQISTAFLALVSASAFPASFPP